MNEPEKNSGKTGKFVKGESGNPNGRPKGTPNKTTSELREILRAYIESEVNYFTDPERLGKMDDSERRDFLIKVLPYVLPKAPETSIVQQTTTITSPDFEIINDTESS